MGRKVVDLAGIEPATLGVKQSEVTITSTSPYTDIFINKITPWVFISPWSYLLTPRARF